MASNMSDHNSQIMDKSHGSNNVINLTTSETLRLDGDRTNLHLQAAGSAPSQPYPKKKNSSFQITSITSRLSNDGGEDSADDTEDISDIMDSSKVTDFDQETPSFSEDYSKSEEVFFGPAPVIPTSSQYGITALVQQTGSGGVMTAMLPQGVTVNVTEGGIALAKADGESDDVNHWQNRFKIVKIDSNEPFKRGRWICLDFMDSPAVTAASSQKKDESSVVVNSVSLKEIEAGDHQPQTVVQLSVPIPQQSQAGQTQPHSVSVPAQYQVPHSTQASTPMVPSTQTSQGGVPIQSSTHLSGTAAAQGQGTLQYPSQGAAMQGQLQPMSQGYPAPSQAAQGQAAVHPSSSAQTPPQSQPPLQQPTLQQPPLQQPPPSQPNVQSTVQAASLSQSNLQQGSVTQPAIQQGMVPPSSITQPPQHQPVQAQSSLPQTTINAQSIPQQGIPGQTQTIPQQGIPGQTVPQPGVIGQAGMPAQSLQPTVISGIAAQGMVPPVVTHQGVPTQPTSVMTQPQSNLPQQSVPQASLGQKTVVTSGPSPQQMTQTLPSQPLPGTQQIQQVAAPQQMTTGQQLPVTQQISSTIVQPGVHSQTAVGTSQQMTAAAPSTSVKSPQVSHVSHPGTGSAPTPATTPAQGQAHHSMGAPTVQSAPSGEQQSSQPQPQQSQPQQPPSNLEGIPPGQPMDDAANATPPAGGSGQPDDTERKMKRKEEGEEVASTSKRVISVDGLARALFSGVLTCPGHQDLPVTPVLSALMHPPYTPPSHTPPSHTPRAHTPTGQTPPPHTPPPISVAAKIMGVGSFSSMDVAPASSAGNSRRPNKDAPIRYVLLSTIFSCWCCPFHLAAGRRLLPVVSSR
ncbi:protein bunched, class 2/F/G isoform isoform X3 [Cherax quadricarinatus]|uniref:protein bunched, class 2/F/G isoform isoform X3 n=1 Tax=Cherax quadricarinatus TaxID=27406 RepID=UPI00387EA9C4